MEKIKINPINLKEGKFCYCARNCTCCVYYEPRNTNSRGEGYCNYYSCHYYPSKRQGCLSHKCINN